MSKGDKDAVWLMQVSSSSYQPTLPQKRLNGNFCWIKSWELLCHVQSFTQLIFKPLGPQSSNFVESLE
jgi:hypothetical protein